MSITSEELVQNILTHHGVLGMRWGHRKSGEVSGFSQRHPHAVKAAKIGGTVAVGVGVVAVAVLLAKRGKSPVKASTTVLGKKTVNSFSDKVMLQHMVTHGKSPTADSMHEMAKTLKPNEFIIWNHITNLYEVSKTQGYNPNTGSFGF